MAKPDYVAFCEDVLGTVTDQATQMGPATVTQFLFDGMATLKRALQQESDEPMNAFIQQYHGWLW